MSAAYRDVLDYWFAPPDSPEHGQARSVWFAGGETADQEIKTRFRAIHMWAATGLLDAWHEQADPMLALVLVLDQFSRHLYRDQPKAFAFDGKALKWAEAALREGFDRQLTPLQRVFLYLPFEHAESLPAQERSLELFTELSSSQPGLEGFLDYARRHHEIIARFGRFPHRNALLGRESTAEELVFLELPGSRF